MVPLSPSNLTVAVLGASGFVGRHLIATLSKHARVVALSRSSQASVRAPEQSGRGIEWRQCDLFSLNEAEAALEGCDVAVYLVHSMMPQARLTQGKFEDIDLWLADNFARAAASRGVQRIVYLGGIQPNKDASPHLKSREEVEVALASYKTPVIALRAGMVLGQGGSSFIMMKRLVENLPVMVCPAWTQTKSNPIDIEDVTAVICRVVLDGALAPGSYDLGGSETVTYMSMMRETARALGVRRLLIPFPYVNPRLSSLWVRLVTSSPKQLVNPLVMSLTCDMVPKEGALWARYGIKPKGFVASLCSAMGASPMTESFASKAHAPPARPESLVVSIQRLPRVKGQKPLQVMNAYFDWLQSAFGWLVQVRSEYPESNSLAPTSRQICLIGAVEALSFVRKSARCTDSREVLEIAGGVLAAPKSGRMPRFECRSTMMGEATLIGVLDFKPRLPWRIYKYTQAIAHSAIMRAFAARSWS